MNRKLNNLMLVVISALLFSACGQLEVVPPPTQAPEVMVTATESQINLPTAVGSASENFSRYIGVNYPPYPEGLTERFAMLMEAANDHSLSLLLEGENSMLWLSQLTHLDASGNAFWEVKDVLDLSNIEAGTVLIPDGCLINDVPDNEVVAVAENGTIVSAWRANTALNVFEVIPTEGIECRSDKAVTLE